MSKTVEILIPGGQIVSLIGPLDSEFARERNMNPIMKAMFWLMSRKINKLSARRHVKYTFHFVHQDGGKLAAIPTLVDAGHIRPVIDRVITFDDTLSALSYLKAGQAKGKVVVELPVSP